MAMSRQRDEWNRTSAMMTIVNNTGFAAKHRDVRPVDFNPYATGGKSRRKPSAVPVPFSVLRQVFCPESIAAEKAAAGRLTAEPEPVAEVVPLPEGVLIGGGKVSISEAKTRPQ